MKSASVFFSRSNKFVLPGVALAGLAVGIYLTRSGNVDVLAASAAASTDTVDRSSLTTARQLAALAHGDAEQEKAMEAVQAADDAVDQASLAALREAEAAMNPLTGEALATSQQIARLESTVEEEKQHVVALTTARLKTASQNDVADLGERAQMQLDLDTNKLRELRRDLILLGGDKQARIQQALDEYDALREQPIAYPTAENDLESSQKLVTLPGKVRAFFEMRAREKQLRHAAEEATAAAARISRHKEASDARIQDEQQLAAIYGSWAELTKAKRVNLQHSILLALAILVGIFLAVPFGVVLIRRELAGRFRESRRRYPMIAELVVEALGLAMILIVIFGIPGRTPVSLG